MFQGLTGEKKSDTLWELLCGIAVYGVIGELVILCFASQKLHVSIGWWLGIVIAAFCAYHMWWGLDRALDIGEKGAMKHVMIYNIVRYVVIIFIMALVIKTEIGNPLAALFGIFALKAGAYMQPLVHKFNKHAQ